MAEHTNAKPLLRDLAVYMITSVRFLLLKGKPALFLKNSISFFRWRVFRVSAKTTIDYQIPWMSFAAIDYLKTWFRNEMVVFEYGSGGSSLFIAQRVQQLYSIDHDEAWYDKVQQLITEKNIANIEYALCKPVPAVADAKKDCGHPSNYLSCMGEFKNLDFEAYVRSIDKFPNESFDLVIVDGRARPSCIQHAIPKIKKGGALLLDNADRGYYLQPFAELNDTNVWSRKTFIGHYPYSPASVMSTTILFTKKG
ncbi:MAG: hypothetical protein ACOVP7_04400 [Lacibacter sp.]